ncbi:hypothetical protein F383_36099 [Gossypium arboreum]|uniref:Uncharacterized protein n=1 Tax=Gossypium arboreum TaxID=29729 RepID=A0A0B0PZB4_GOSAR|nr:hypothetical protein F383_36099 [Gossypium arboreum]
MRPALSTTHIVACT